MSNYNNSKSTKPSPTGLPHVARRMMVSGLLILIICSLASGCRTAAFDRLKMPKLPTMKMPKLSPPKKLAFWKKDKLEMPPPPARHFSPSGTENSAATQYANNASSNNMNMDSVKQRIDNVLDTQKNNYGAATESLAQTAEAAVQAIPKNSFAKSDLPSATDFSSAPKKSGLSNAQNQFNSALANTKKAFDAPTGLKDPTKPTTGGWKDGGFKLPGLNDVAADTKGQLKSAQSGFKDAMSNVNSTQYDSAGNLIAAKSAASDFASKNPFKSGFKKPDAFPKSNALAKVNQSLYDAKGRLVSGSKDLAKGLPSVVPNAMGQAKSNFDSAIGRVGNVAKSTQAATNDFVANGTDKLKQSFNNVKQAVPAPRPSNSFAGSFKPAPLNNQPLRSAPPTSPPSTTTPFSSAPFSSAPASSMAMNNGPTNPNASFQPAQTPIQTAPPKSSIASSNAFRSSNSGFYGNGGYSQGVPANQPTSTTAPANILRNGFPIAQAGGNDSGAPQFSNASSMPVSQTNGAATPVSHVAEIDIPANVLSGSSSYAPGSVHALR